MRTWYEVLGVPQTATGAEVRAAYRRHARSLHPDSRDPSLPADDADAALRLLNQAWDVLGDPAERARYDDALEESAERADGTPWDSPHRRSRFPWWLLALAVLFVIFVFTAYAGPAPTP